MKKKILVFFICTIIKFNVFAQTSLPILPGAYQTEQYFPLLKNKQVGLFTNQTATIHGKHLIDTLIASGISVRKIFTPEHGLRGNADAGEQVKDAIDPTTGIKIISLYGIKNAPDANDLADIDILIFDVQDVGTRFYTYIYSLEYFMEAAIAHHKPLIILDRPNPNGHYIDGPVLEAPFTSGVGKHPIPIVYGLTIGEYAQMTVGEHWLQIDSTNNLDHHNWAPTIIRNKNYDHNSLYVLDVAPSPNLPDMQSIYWYATTCLIEGTVMSEGRGTEHAFCYIGHPTIPHKTFSFIPSARAGAMNSKLFGQRCFGWDLTKVQAPKNKINLSLLIEIYKNFPEKDSFFLAPKNKLSTDFFFNRLAGNASLMEQLVTGASEATIRSSWQPDLIKFKAMRKKYLLYKDAESL